MKLMDNKMRICLILIAIVSILMLIYSKLIQDQTEYANQYYVVQNGDSLYNIAAKLGIENWRKWAYEVKKANQKYDYNIYSGEEIIIQVVKTNDNNK